jgi:hypothetical protein
MGYPDYSSSTGWPYFARREYDNAASDRGQDHRATQLCDALSAGHLAWITATDACCWHEDKTMTSFFCRDR